MIGLLQRYNVGPRLGAAFGLLVLLTVGLSGMGLWALHHTEKQLEIIAKENVAKLRLSQLMLETNLDIEVGLRNAILAKTDADEEAAQSGVRAQRARFVKARADLEALPASPAARAIRERIDAARTALVEVNERILALSRTDDEAAEALLKSEGVTAMQEAQDAIRANLERQEMLTAQAYETAEQVAAHGRAALITGGVLVFVLSALLAWAITRSMTAPLTVATGVANAIAEGRFDNVINANAQDETGRLLASMQRMQNTLNAYSNAQLDMGRRHDEGDIGFRIDADAFSGSYARMADNTNALVDSHLTVMDEMSALTQRYAIGDLSGDMRELPGGKARITDAMRTTKRNLQAVNTQITLLADAAARGDFSERGDETAYQFALRDMVAALNRLMQEADAGIGDVGRIMSALADGDLTQRVERQYQGAFGRLADDANTTVAQLTGIVSRIQSASGAISTASSEIASGNDDLSQRTEQQAANLEETAASMEELTSTVRQNADHARQANQLVIGAAQVASQGGEVVGRVVDTMGAIEQSSRRIADIISVIDGIAFQTNILALNAAVEAARAGEQGRGFAVVASEVRTLAQRSAAAAKEIKQLIDDSTSKVSDGAVLAAQAGKTMDEIVGSVQRVTDIMSEIAAASQEQAAGIEQVNQTVVQMDETTQQNAALVEEASAAARAMEEQAAALTETVALFRTSGSTVQAPRPQPVVQGASRPTPRKAAARSKPTTLSRPAAVSTSHTAETVSADAAWAEF